MGRTGFFATWQSWAPYFLGLFRIVAAAIFITSGTTKMFGWPSGMPAGMEFELMSQIGLAAVLEVFGGALILLGLFTRPVAFILSGEMAVAYFQAHAPQSVWPTINQGIPAILFCFLFLYLSAAGPGAFSFDRLFRRTAANRY